MKQSQKTLRTRQRILSAAIEEFGAYGYEKGSINRICSENGVPKGLVYHNFKNKDDLYLQTIECCLEGILTYLKKNEAVFSDAKEQLAQVLALRQSYYEKNNFSREIFFQSILQVPAHLERDIRVLHYALDQYFSSIFAKIISLVQLRDNITHEMAMNLFDILHKTYSAYFQNKASSHSLSELMQSHEGQLPTLLNVLLFGIAVS